MWILWLMVILLVWLGSRETYISAPYRLVPHDSNKISLSESEYNKFFFGNPVLHDNAKCHSATCKGGQYGEAPIY